MAGMQRQKSISGPYKATQLWNEIMSSFRTGMPLKRHWWRMKTHEECFTASEAVTWLQTHLQSLPDFGPGVTRQQAMQLLIKFQKSGLLRPVHRSKGRHGTKLGDNGELYRFTEKRPGMLLSPSRPPLLPINSGGAEEQVELSPESACQRLPSHLIHAAWKEEVLERLSKCPGVAEAKGIAASGHWIMVNATRTIGGGGVAMGDTDSLPHWLLSAMTCLAHAESGEYPGFRGDVLRVVEEHLSSLPNPLVPSSLQPLFIHAIRHALEAPPYPHPPPPPRTASPVIETCFALAEPVTRLVNPPPGYVVARVSAPNAARHLRSRSGGYVNPAMEMDEEAVHEAVATLEQLVEAARHQRSTSPDSVTSVGSSYHTAHSVSQYDASVSQYDASDEDGSDVSEPYVSQSPPTPQVSDKGRFERTVKLLLLLLPPDRRRQLHLLARMVSRLQADPPPGRRAGAGPLLAKAVLRPNADREDEDATMVAGRALLRFLAEGHDAVFNPPGDLGPAVRQRLVEVAASGSKLQRSWSSMDSTVFCARVTQEEFEHQKEAGSRAALAELLDQILKDPRVKDRAYRIQKFREAYPHIFRERFPGTDALGLSDHLIGEENQANGVITAPKKQKSCTRLFPTLSRMKSLRL